MKFCLLALGSRGDVQPFVALGRGLQARGHDVVIAAAEDYRDLVSTNGIAFAPLVGRIADLMDQTAVAHSLDGGPLGSLSLALRLRTDAAPLLDALFADTLRAAQNCDVLIVSTLGQHVGHSVAEKCHLPVVTAHFHPYTPSAHYTNMFFGEWPLRRHGQKQAALYNRFTHRMGINGFWHLLQPSLNGARKRVLGLPPLTFLDVERLVRQTQHKGLHLHAYGPRLVPPPPDWNPDRHVVTGYWHCPQMGETDSLPPDLRAFLRRGAPPVYLGFGSILGGRDPDKMTRLFVDALHQAGARGVLYRGWGDLGNIPLAPSLFVTNAVSHDALFPRCAALVHHGGAGTTAAGLRAGVPAVVVPVFGDQRFWAALLYREGASPAPIPRSRLTKNALAYAIEQALSNDGFKKRTNALQKTTVEENGVENAVSVLEKWLS